MCLITPNKTLKIADKDITVYKVIGMNLSAIFQDMKYEFGILNKTTLKESNEWSSTGAEDLIWLTENGFSKRKNKDKLICIGQGFHSLLTLKMAKGLKKHFIAGIIVECTIPKGSEYYDSPFDYLVSNQLIINKKV